MIAQLAVCSPSASFTRYTQPAAPLVLAGHKSWENRTQGERKALIMDANAGGTRMAGLGNVGCTLQSGGAYVVPLLTSVLPAYRLAADGTAGPLLHGLFLDRTTQPLPSRTVGAANFISYREDKMQDTQDTGTEVLKVLAEVGGRCAP